MTIFITLFYAFIGLTSQNCNAMPDNRIESYVEQLKSEFHLIRDERKEELKELAEVIHELLEEQGSTNLNFICTHNSRRSQLAESWFRYASNTEGVKNINCYSGGSEATAFNHRMVDAIQRTGMDLRIAPTSGISDYQLYIDNNPVGPLMFSKKYDHEHNPAENFIAVMVCSDADQNCPIVNGSSARVSLPYEDPKAFDDTEQESQAYDDKVKEIGREIYYLISLLK